MEATVKLWRMPVLVLFITFAAASAGAAPIQAYGGWLDATFRVYDYGYKTIDGQVYFYPNELRREFVLGVDFFPAVPLDVTQAGTSYSVCLASNNLLVPECKNQLIPWTVSGSGIYGEPATQSPLADGCVPNTNPYSNDPVLLVSRGGCSFLQKWQVAQNGGWGALLVAETTDGLPVGPVGLVPSSDQFTIPLLRITHEVASEIRRGSSFPDDRDGARGIPWVEIQVSWSLDPPPPPIPEPPLLSLIGIGSALVAARVRRRSRGGPGSHWWHTLRR
jgi:hypothetical protein